MPSGKLGFVAAAPSAARLTSSLRDIGYDFQTAVADLVDNSVAAGATRVDIELQFEGSDSWLTIADDGIGMTANGLVEAMRFGTRRSYALSDLGRYGLGLKTASLSQCRRVTVVTRRSLVNAVIARRSLDLDLVAQHDAWLLAVLPTSPPVEQAAHRLQQGPGTVVVWEKLDRVLPERSQEGGWARRRLASYAQRLTEHLGMVFHRFLAGHVSPHTLTICVNGEKVRPWDPFALDEPGTRVLPAHSFELGAGETLGRVMLRRYVLPPRDGFSSLGEFERLSGPLKWNRQQGLYIYRANRLVHWGGWAGLRAVDEHTKLARAALEFNTDLDEVFHINVAKMRVSVPAQLRPMIERPVHELCTAADEVYRSTSATVGVGRLRDRPAQPAALPPVAIAFGAAAMQLGHTRAFNEVVALVAERDPELVRTLGF